MKVLLLLLTLTLGSALAHQEVVNFEVVEIATSNIKASYYSRLYDSYGYLERGVYYQTAPLPIFSKEDLIKTARQWPR